MLKEDSVQLIFDNFKASNEMKPFTSTNVLSLYPLFCIREGVKKSIFVYNSLSPLREDTHKKIVFLLVGSPRFYPPYINGLVVHFFFSLFSLKRIFTIFFFFFPIFGLKQPLSKKKCFFA